MELNKKGKKLQAEGVKYGEIEQHYKRSDFCSTCDEFIALIKNNAAEKNAYGGRN